MDKAAAGDNQASALLRILTPLVKLRACRDNIPVATGAMEVRGGNGYIEEWVNARLVRDAHIGVLWEGTSNINALDVCSVRSANRARTRRWRRCCTAGSPRRAGCRAGISGVWRV